MNRFKDNKVFICVFLTACYTGMRTGEVFALTWDDIDLENRIRKINKTVYDKDNEKNRRFYKSKYKYYYLEQVKKYRKLIEWKNKKENIEMFFVKKRGIYRY